MSGQQHPPVLFLDIDGVLNGHSFNQVAQSCGLLDLAVEQLNRVIEMTGCQIVLSSAWRYMIHGGAMTAKGFEYLLRTHGVTQQARILGITVPDEQLANRDDQILEWLSRHPEVERWAVVDDAEGLSLDKVSKHLVKTVGKYGLRGQEANRLIWLLRGEQQELGKAGTE